MAHGSHNDPPRNEFERKEGELIEHLKSFFRGSELIHMEIALGELLILYHGEIERRDTMLRAALKYETKRCEQCPGRHLKRSG